MVDRDSHPAIARAFGALMNKIPFEWWAEAIRR
jgi:hypothetical protein